MYARAFAIENEPLFVVAFAVRLKLNCKGPESTECPGLVIAVFTVKCSGPLLLVACLVEEAVGKRYVAVFNGCR